MEIGERVQVRAYKADGSCYRWWQATVEAFGADRVVLVTPAGHRVRATDGGWTSQYAIRAFYWPDCSYSLLEAHAPDGRDGDTFV